MNNTFDEQKNNNVYVNLNNENSLLTVEGQKKLMRYRMRFMWPILLIVLLPLIFSLYNSFRLSQVARQKVLQQQVQSIPNIQQQAQQIDITTPQGKCQALTLGQYGSMNSPQAQQFMAQCNSIEAQAEYQRAVKK
jgi:hypothetical protein